MHFEQITKEKSNVITKKCDNDKNSFHISNVLEIIQSFIEYNYRTWVDVNKALLLLRNLKYYFTSNNDQLT